MLVLESIGTDYFQGSPLAEAHTLQALHGAAQLHAAAWEDQELLR